MIPSDGKPHLTEKENISRYLNIEVSYLEHFYLDSENGMRIPGGKKKTVIPLIPCIETRFAN